MKLIEMYRGLQNCFIQICHCSSKNIDNQTLFKDTIEQIKNYQQCIIDNQLASECPVLMYCINTLFEIIRENNKEKLYQFADTVHNMPEIYLGKRTYDSFSLEIKSFCDAYGDSYFACL